jgi:hypothetical protein
MKLALLCTLYLSSIFVQELRKPRKTSVKMAEYEVQSLLMETARTSET